VSTEATIPSRVGVLGGGRMGAGIAHGFALAGAAVFVVERDQQSAEAARERVESSLAAVEGQLGAGAWAVQQHVMPVRHRACGSVAAA
jgi:3-hydroxyacyl-CoA dehydrogenase